MEQYFSTEYCLGELAWFVQWSGCLLKCKPLNFKDCFLELHSLNWITEAVRFDLHGWHRSDIIKLIRSLHLLFHWQLFILKNGINTYASNYSSLWKHCFICPCSEPEGSTSPQLWFEVVNRTSTHPAVTNSCTPAVQNSLPWLFVNVSCSYCIWNNLLQLTDSFNWNCTDVTETILNTCMLYAVCCYVYCL